MYVEFCGGEDTERHSQGLHQGIGYAWCGILVTKDHCDYIIRGDEIILVSITLGIFCKLLIQMW